MMKDVELTAWNHFKKRGRFGRYMKGDEGRFSGSLLAGV